MSAVEIRAKPKYHLIFRVAGLFQILISGVIMIFVLLQIQGLQDLFVNGELLLFLGLFFGFVLAIMLLIFETLIVQNVSLNRLATLYTLSLFTIDVFIVALDALSAGEPIIFLVILLFALPAGIQLTMMFTHLPTRRRFMESDEDYIVNELRDLKQILSKQSKEI